MVTLITAALGIIGTVVAWYFNPKRILYAQLDDIYKQLEILYVRRDKALESNNSDELTIVTSSIVQLCTRKNVLLRRL